jgi:hypothetical protein
VLLALIHIAGTAKEFASDGDTDGDLP